MFRESQTIGYYTLIRKLGEGGFGEVWLAENRNNSLSEKVAIKLPRKDQIDLQSVKDEIFNWILSGKHKNILPIIECETFGNQIALVSEFAPDGSLKDLLKKHGSFSVADAVEIVIGILDGLAHLHNRKIVHRDLKPDNILFQGRTPRLTDFGISRALPVDSQSQTVSGTLSYMAPEAFDGKRNERTDIWSIGVILYKLLTGNLPFPQKEKIELIGALATKEPAPLPDSVPLTLQTVVKKSLAKESAERYQAAGEMAKELRQCLQKSYEPTLKIPLYEVLPTKPSPTIIKPVSTNPIPAVVELKTPLQKNEAEENLIKLKNKKLSLVFKKILTQITVSSDKSQRFNKFAGFFYIPIMWIPQIAAIISLVIFRQNLFLRFHAIQSLLLFVSSVILFSSYVTLIGFLGKLYLSEGIIAILFLLPLFAWGYFQIFHARKAYNGKMAKILIIGNIATYFSRL